MITKFGDKYLEREYMSRLKVLIRTYPLSARTSDILHFHRVSQHVKELQEMNWTADETYVQFLLPDLKRDAKSLSLYL